MEEGTESLNSPNIRRTVYAKKITMAVRSPFSELTAIVCPLIFSASNTIVVAFEDA